MVFRLAPSATPNTDEGGSLRSPVQVREKLGPWYHAALGSGLDARNKILQKTGTEFLCKPTALA